MSGNRKINTSPTAIDEPAILKKMLTDPPVKKIDLHFPLGLEVTARNLKGVTIKDALDAIHKSFKKRVSFPHSTCARLRKKHEHGTRACSFVNWLANNKSHVKFHLY
jgi:hypothetical protein